MPRYYLTNGAAPYTPETLRGGWDFTNANGGGGSVTRLLSTDKDAGSAGQSNPYFGFVSAIGNYFYYRGVSAGLAVGDLPTDGTVNLCAPVGVNAAGLVCDWRVHVYITSGDSDTPRATLINSYQESGNPWPRPDAGLVLAAPVGYSGASYSAGDRLVVELGCRLTSGMGYHGFSFGTEGLTDATNGSATTTAGWVEFVEGEPEPVEAFVSAAYGLTLTQDVVASAQVSAAYALTLTRHSETIETTVSAVYALALTSQPAASEVSSAYALVLLRPPLYNCPGASPGPSLCGQENVLTWIEETQHLVGSPDSSVRVVSDIALPDPSSYYHGRKEPRVLEFGAITRRLSDARGQWQGATMRWREAEIDRVLRGRLADPDLRALTRAEVVCRMIRYSDWVRKATPRTMFIGQVTQVEPDEDLSTSVEAGDELAHALDVEEATCPRRLISPRYLPGVPTDAIDTGEPIIYGQMSGALSDVTPPTLTGDPARGAFVDGGVQVFGYGDLPDPPAPPTGVTLTELSGAGHILAGDAPANTFYAFVTSVDADGNESDPDTFAQRDAGLVASVVVTGGSPGSAIEVSWTGPGSPTPVAYRVYLGWNYYRVRVVQRLHVAAGSPTSVVFDNSPSYTEWTLNDWSELATGAVASPFTFFADWAVSAVVNGEETALSDVGTAKAEGYRRPIRVEWTDVPGATEYRVYRRATAGAAWDRRWVVPVAGSPATLYFDDDLEDTGVTYVTEGPVDRGAVPVIYTGQETLTSTGETWHRFLVCGHAIAGIDAWYLDDVLEDPATAGVDYLIPGYPGWAERFGTPTYRDLGGRRYTVIYARGPKGDGLAGLPTGSPPATTDAVLTLNVRGIEDRGDGSGALITDLFEQYLHWFINFGPLGDYQVGLWLPAPTWLPIATHCRIDSDSFRAAKAEAGDDVDGGYEGGGYLREPAPLRDWLARWSLSTDTRVGLGAAGQWRVVRHPSDPDTPLVRTYTEVRHIQAGSLKPSLVYDEHWNVMPYRYRFDPVGDAWDVTDEVFSQDSITTYGVERPRPTTDLWFVRSGAVADAVMARALARHADPPLKVVFDTIDLCGTLSEIGDVIGVTHIAGTDPAGWTMFRVVVDGIIVHPAAARTTIETRALVAPHLAG